MKRDNDYFRLLLQRMEESEDTDFLCVETDSSSLEERRERYHILLAEDAGYVTRLTPKGQMFRLTNEGHNFVETTRDAKIWEAAKATAKKAGGASIQMLGQIALDLLKEKIFEKTGFKLQ